jgi:hypothetical protein
VSSTTGRKGLSRRCVLTGHQLIAIAYAVLQRCVRVGCIRRVIMQSRAPSSARLHVWLLLAACGPPPQSPRVRDSAGVRIVEVAASALDLLPRWTIGSAQVVVGGADAPDSLQVLRGRTPTRMSDGAVVVSTERSRLLVVDTSGVKRLTVGRRGRGPGEFEELWSFAVLIGDTIVAHDPKARRISVFTRDGQLVRTAAQTLYAGFGPLYSADGSMAAIDDGISNRIFLAGREYSGIHQDTASVLFFTRLEAGPAQRVLTVPSKWVWVGDGLLEAIVYSGTSLLARDRQRLITAHGDRFAVDAWTTAGEKLTSLRVAVSRPRLGSRAKDYVFDSVRARRPATTDESLSRLRFAELVPVLEELKVDATGCIWARLWSDPWNTSYRWIVVDARSGPVAQTLIPKRIRVSEIGADAILGIAVDENDVQSVVLARIARSVRCDDIADPTDR